MKMLIALSVSMFSLLGFILGLCAAMLSPQYGAMIIPLFLLSYVFASNLEETK